MASENKQVVSYNEDDWRDLCERFNLDVKPHIPQRTTDDLILYFLSLKYYGHAYRKYHEVFFEIPFEELPLHINDKTDMGTNGVKEVVLWRIRRGK